MRVMVDVADVPHAFAAWAHAALVDRVAHDGLPDSVKREARARWNERRRTFG